MHVRILALALAVFAFAGLAPAELLRRRVEQMLLQGDEEFSQAAQYLLQKNAELYRRLA